MLLISGADLAVYARRLAQKANSGDLTALLDNVTHHYPAAVDARRPEEILND